MGARGAGGAGEGSDTLKVDMVFSGVGVLRAGRDGVPLRPMCSVFLDT